MRQLNRTLIDHDRDQAAVTPAQGVQAEKSVSETASMLTYSAINPPRCTESPRAGLTTITFFTRIADWQEGDLLFQ